jgi:hypothetical protein
MVGINGFDGCPKDKVSSVLSKLDIEDNYFSLNSSLLLLLYFLVLKVLSLIISVIKANSLLFSIRI